MQGRTLNKTLLWSACLSFMLAAPVVHSSDTYPTKPIRVVVPFTPAGAADVVARTIGEKLSDRLGQPVVVENKPGAGGSIAAEFVTRATPDGYTLLVADLGQLAITPALNKKLKYDPLRDLIPIGSVATVPLFVSVNPKLPINSTKALIEHAKQNPNRQYATPGIGTSHHLAMEMFAAQAGISLTHIPYKGSTQTLPAVIAGDVDMTISALAPLRPHAEANRLRIVAVASAKRSPLAPDIPAISEDLPGYAIEDILGFLAPAGTPSSVIEQLNKELAAIVRAPEVEEVLANRGLQADNLSSSDYYTRIKQSRATFGKVIDQLGISID